MITVIYCESGDTVGDTASAYYTTDPVWDGLDCSDSLNCCATPTCLGFMTVFCCKGRFICCVP